MVQCVNTYNSSTAWGYEEECLWGQAHGDAKIEGGGWGWERLYAASPVQRVFKWYFKVFVDYQQQIQIRHCT